MSDLKKKKDKALKSLSEMEAAVKNELYPGVSCAWSLNYCGLIGRKHHSKRSFLNTAPRFFCKQ